jgi:hypothetical protein
VARDWSEKGTARYRRPDGGPARHAPTFGEDRGVTAVLPTGESAGHQWFLKNQYIWVRWRDKSNGRSGRGEIPLEFQGPQLFLAWPPGTQESYMVFERVRE